MTSGTQDYVTWRPTGYVSLPSHAPAQASMNVATCCPPPGNHLGTIWNEEHVPGGLSLFQQLREPNSTPLPHSCLWCAVLVLWNAQHT